MNGQRSTFGRGEEALGRHVDRGKGESPRKIAPWPWATTPWNWSEKRDQFEAFRLKKSQIH